MAPAGFGSCLPWLEKTGLKMSERLDADFLPSLQCLIFLLSRPRAKTPGLRITIESQSVFQAETQAKCFLLNRLPAAECPVVAPVPPLARDAVAHVVAARIRDNN